MYQKIILGTAQFGMNYGISNKTGKIKTKNITKILDLIKKNKINLLDTANSYQKSEKEIGNYFRKKNIKFKVITKYSFANNKNIKTQLEETYKNLGYYPDTIFAHNYKDYISNVFQEEIKNIKKDFPIKNYGVSLYNPIELKKIIEVKKPDIIQVPCNILDKRFLSSEIINLLEKKSIKLHARSIFLQGLFFQDKKKIYKKFKNVTRIFKKLYKIAIEENLSIGELSLIWAYKKKEINKIVIGVDGLTHLQDNFKSIKKKISNKNYKIIDQLNLHENKIIKPYLWKIKQ